MEVLLDKNYLIADIVTRYGLPLFSILAIAVIQYLLAIWLKTRLETSIKYFYDKKMAEFNYDIHVREQAAKIADFFAEWSRGEQADKSKLAKYSMELSLWLPAEIYKEIAKCVCCTEERINSNEILVRIRKYLLRDSAGTLNANDIINL
jgi:hypothetical protein